MLSSISRNASLRTISASLQLVINNNSPKGRLVLKDIYVQFASAFPCQWLQDRPEDRPSLVPKAVIICQICRNIDRGEILISGNCH